MGIYYEQLLTVRGPEGAMAAFVGHCCKMSEAGRPLGFAMDDIAELPLVLPDGHWGNDTDDGEPMAPVEVKIVGDDGIAIRFTTKGLPAAALSRSPKPS